MRVAYLREEDGSYLSVLGKPGRIYTPYVRFDYPVRMRRMANGDIKKYTRDADKVQLKKLCRALIKFGNTKHNTITKGARKLLRGAWA